MVRRPWCLVPALALAGCSFSPSGAGPDGGEACAPACSAASDELITCSPTGEPIHQACPLGCVEGPGGPACASTLVPSNVDPATLQRFTLAQVGAELPLAPGGRMAIDSDNGTIWLNSGAQLISIRTGEGISNLIGFERVSSTLSVLAVTRARVPAGATLEVYGGRALVVLATGDIDLAGRVRADGGLCDQLTRRGSCGGPGGGDGGGEGGGAATGCAPGGGGDVRATATGGGGGGMATGGGKGGDSPAMAAVGGAAGLVGACGDERLVPLVGGGGGGASRIGEGGSGGGGGGGLQLTAFGAFTIEDTAVLSAVGSGGTSPSFVFSGGGGGGAGGARLLEAASVTVASGARVSVTGGGGGGGRWPATDGEAGRTDGGPALGGLGDGPDMLDGLGGNGAIDSVAALDGRGNAAGDLDGTGGGGGGLGRIRINTVRGDVARGAGFFGRYSAGHVGRR